MGHDSFHPWEIKPTAYSPDHLREIVVATVAVAVNDLVLITGGSGQLPQVVLGATAAKTTTIGDMKIAVSAKGATTNPERVQVVPWRVLRGTTASPLDTSSVAANAPVYLGAGGAWSLTAGANPRRVGTVLVSDATVGVIKLDPGAFYGEPVAESQDIAQTSVPAADGAAGVGLWIPKTFLAGPSTTDFALPTRGGGWRVVDAYIRSDGVTGGTVQVQTAGGAANVSDTMVPGNANVITRAGEIDNANATFASGATVRLDIAAGAPAGEAFIRVEPL